MPNVIPFKVHTIDEVYDDLPPGIRPSKPKFVDLVERHGLYRELADKKRFMLQKDVEALFEIIRARPREADLRGGPARLIAGDRSPNELGYLVVIGDALDRDAAVFIGWAPRDATGVDDLKRLIQYGYPGKLSTLDFHAATPAEVEDVREQLKRSSVGVSGWFVRSDAVNGFLVALRDQRADAFDYSEIENKGAANT